MKMALGAVALLALLLFGCVSQPAQPQQSTGVGYFDRSFTAGTFSNNSSSTGAVALNTPLSMHSFTVAYNGNWANAIANVTLTGSLDGQTWVPIASIQGNTTGYVNVWSTPLMYVNFSISRWNASTNPAVANLTISYAGTAVDSTDQATASLNSTLFSVNSTLTGSVNALNSSKRDLTNMTFYNSTAIFTNLTGTGNMYVCVNASGALYRNATCS